LGQKPKIPPNQPAVANHSWKTNNPVRTRQVKHTMVSIDLFYAKKKHLRDQWQ